MSKRPGPPSAGPLPHLNAAIAHHQAGRLKEADALYRQVLAASPKHVDAMHLLGVIAMQTGRLDEAHTLISNAIALNPKFAAAQNNLGNVYLRQGRLDDALASFERAVKLQPGFGDAHYNLGNQLRRQGRLNEAATQFRRAATADRKSVSAHTSLGATLLDLGDPQGAVSALEDAVRLRPDYAETLGNLGLALAGAGELQRALDVLDRAHTLDPKDATVLRNRGTVLARLGRHAEARQCLEAVVAATPEAAAAHCNLGNLLREAGTPTEALERFRRAVELDPRLTEARIGLMLAMRDLGRDDEAQDLARRLALDQPTSAAVRIFEGTQCLERDDTKGAVSSLREAIALQPSNAEAHYLLGTVLMRQLRATEAIEAYEQALALDPGHVRARWSLTMAQIPPIFAAAADVAPSRAKFARMLAELDRFFNAKNGAQGDKAVGALQPYYLAYQATANRDLLARYGTLCARLMERWRTQHLPPLPAPASGRIRVGIASAQLREHSVWNAIVKGWVRNLDRDRFEVSLFNLSAKSDAETELARSWSHRLESGRRELHQWATLIAGCGLDVLIYPEIGMDPMTVKLASLRLARTQAATWGHPETTGLPTIDHYLSAEAFEPANAAAHYTERLVVLPHLGVCYEPLLPAAVAPDLVELGLPQNVPLLLCPGMPFKYSPLHDDIWVEISRRAAPCRLVFFRPAHREASPLFEQRLEQSYAKAGLRFADCASFIPMLDRGRYFGLMQRADLMLDTLGFSGFNTAIQAIECGLPVVSREGEFMRGRLGSGILRRMGMDALVATSDADYVELATTLARDGALRKKLRDEILERRTVLFGDLEPVRALERFLESAAGRRPV